MTRWHKSIDQEKWNTYPLETQILMVGSEFARARALARDRAVAEVRLCFERAMELLDWCAGDPKWRGRLRELTRFREMLGLAYLDAPGHDALVVMLYRTLMSWTGTTSRVQL
ncbi:MAG TPA: hypothetical protein VL221_07180 [Bacteroidota bacterium]|nr:hypothetical protein [Bacteroidota bacterium]